MVLSIRWARRGARDADSWLGVRSAQGATTERRRGENTRDSIYASRRVLWQTVLVAAQLAELASMDVASSPDD